MTERTNPDPLLDAPILPTMLRLAAPNIVAMLATTLVAIAETAYVGLLGTTALAGLALVFPLAMLMQMTSAGAMGGGVSSAIARALGAGDMARAEALARHAAAIALIAGFGFAGLFYASGSTIVRWLGGRGEVQGAALAYAHTFCLAIPGIWLANTLASIVRGSGNMRVPSVTLLATALAQVVLGGSLGLGLGPMPKLGMAGVALGQVLAFSGAATAFLWYLAAGRGRVRLGLRGVAFNWEMFRDILKVGAVACASSVQTVSAILLLSGLAARYGTEALAGYGIGARLEFLVVPIVFAFGVAAVPMVGMAVGAGDIFRARRAAWTCGALSAGLVGGVGLLLAIAPDLWVRWFSADPVVLDAARSYLRTAGPAYAFYGLGLGLYFASQGSGKILGPVLAQTVRLVLIVALGPWLVGSGAPMSALFVLIAVGLVAYGLAVAFAMHRTSWGQHGP